MSEAGSLARVVIVDDSLAFCELLSKLIESRFGDRARVETYGHPYEALQHLEDSIDLLIVDVEMPGMDGRKFVDYARQKGLSPRQIIVTSSHPAEELHRRFHLGEAIAVINKTEPKQQEAFLMILDSILGR